MQEHINNNTEMIINDNLMITDKRSYLCVIMPAYNEGAHIRDNLLKASDIISKFIKNYRIIAVNDGSTDNTAPEIMAASIADPRISYISYTPNHGKGHAIATGVKYADAEYIAFLDSDLELNPSMLRYFFEALLATNADIAIGSKLHKRSKLDYPVSRKILSMGYYIILKCLFRLNLKDTQTGIKLFKSSVVKPICENLSTTGFAFDIEILATANKQGCEIIEMPVELNYSRNKSEKSRISFKMIIDMFRDTIHVKKMLRKK